ncbi:MAG TPA: hypothetical protein VIM74_00270 [Casimicrobiaceae bacterium]|jgi:hypothetical protein
MDDKTNGRKPPTLSAGSVKWGRTIKAPPDSPIFKHGWIVVGYHRGISSLSAAKRAKKLSDNEDGNAWLHRNLETGMKRIVALLATGLLVGNASAVLPDSGWYFNPAESGRGFNIEIQGNTLFMAGFIYDAAGNPIWVVSGGPMASDHTYSGAAFQTANGQPLGGSYHAQTNVPFGNATITFPTTVSANITVNGFNFTVTREIFGFDFTSTTQPLLGELAFVSGNRTLPIYFGERISFTSTQTINGLTYAVGNRSGESGSNNLAVGQYSPALNKWTVLLDSSTSYYQFYSFVFEGLNLAEGDESTYLKGTSPSGSLNTIGNRIKSAQAAAGANAPGVTKASMHPGTVGTDSYAAAKVSAQAAQQLEPPYVQTLHTLESVLQSLRQ